MTMLELEFQLRVDFAIHKDDIPRNPASAQRAPLQKWRLSAGTLKNSPFDSRCAWKTANSRPRALR
jgi:hypothetical protein